MKHSIFRQIIAMFFVAILLATIVAGVFSFLYNSGMTAYRSSQYARAGASSAAQVIESVDFDVLKESDTSELYTKTRSVLRSICQSFGLEYLYLYEVNPDGQSIKFIMTVATDEEQDAEVVAKRGLGVVVPRVLTEQEQAALRGEEHPLPYTEKNAFGDVYSWFYPVYGSDGSIIALLGSDYSTSVLFERVVRGTLLIILSMVGVLLLVFVIALFSLQRKIFAPIKLISNRMKGFVADNGVNPDPLPIHSEDEIQEIADSFEKMSGDIRNYIKDIEQLTAERVQKNVELEVAGRIQSGIVPAEATLEEGAYTVYAVAKPAKVVGGDFYDCFKDRDGKICVVIGDVSGKGVAAAMFMVMAKTMIRDCFLGGMLPAEALNAVNDALCRSNPEGMFATVFAAVLDSGSGILHYANAGHTRPVLLGDNAEFLEVDSGIAMGLFEDADIMDCSIRLEKGSGILIYTDGATEAVNTQKKFFGEERLLSAVRKASGARQSVKALGSAVHEFADGAEQFDDYTVLALSYCGSTGQVFSLKPEISNLPQLREAVLKAAGSGSGGRKIYLACEEVFANIVGYSNASVIEVLVEKQNNHLLVKFSDDGVPFDPLSAEAAGKDFEELDSGGMGISLVKQLSDAMDYNRIDGKNVLTLAFALEPAGEEQE